VVEAGAALELERQHHLALSGTLDPSAIAEAKLDLAEGYAERLLEVSRKAVEGLREKRGLEVALMGSCVADVHEGAAAYMRRGPIGV
jgi:hypothetical protein